MIVVCYSMAFMNMKGGFQEFSDFPRISWKTKIFLNFQINSDFKCVGAKKDLFLSSKQGHLKFGTSHPVVDCSLLLAGPTVMCRRLSWCHQGLCWPGQTSRCQQFALLSVASHSIDEKALSCQTWRIPCCKSKKALHHHYSKSLFP